MKSEVSFEGFKVLSYSEFKDQIKVVLPLLNWSLDEDGIAALWTILPDKKYEKFVFDGLMLACDERSRVPGSLRQHYQTAMKNYVAEKRQENDVYIAEELNDRPTYLDDEYLRFLRFRDEFGEARKNGKTSLPNYFEEWQKPLTDLDRSRGGKNACDDAIKEVVIWM